jgi:hypothetical protein
VAIRWASDARTGGFRRDVIIRCEGATQITSGRAAIAKSWSRLMLARMLAPPRADDSTSPPRPATSAINCCGVLFVAVMISTMILSAASREIGR